MFDLGHLVRAHHARPAEALGLLQRGFDVGNLDVEGDVAAVSLGRGPDAAPDADTVGVRVSVTRDDGVVRRPDRVAELPAEQLGVVAAQLVAVLADDLEVDNWLSHLCLLSSPAHDNCSQRPSRRRLMARS